MSHANLAAALAAVQAGMPQLAKGNTAKVPTKAGGSYSYSYADLADVTAVILPLLGRHGLSFTCRPTLDDGRFVLAYALMHESGEHVDGFYPLGQGTPQEIGSGITYARRYALCAVTGLAPGGDDDDGAQAPSAPEPQRREPEGPTPITEQQGKALFALLKATGRSDKANALGFLSGQLRRAVEDIRDLSKSEASRMIESLKAEVALMEKGLTGTEQADAQPSEEPA